ncbi:MAG: efflux RND transporter permease subunit [Lysobacteraceae bacterium]|nr:MAG: efflux RND transporter permease subunit [Xanthomonadaceae bacterium]
MKFSFSTWAIRNPTPPILLFLLLTVAGLFAFNNLPISNVPNVVLPVVNVRLEQPGATPSQLETQVTRRAEAALATLPGVNRITSTITEGVSLTTIEFTLETPLDRAVNDARNEMARIRQDLPATVREPIVGYAVDSNAAMSTYSLEWEGRTPEALSWFLDDTLTRELLSIRGVSRVIRNGGADDEVSIILDPARLSSLGVTSADVASQLAATQVEIPGGRLVLRNVEYAMRTKGKATTLAELEALRIRLPTGGEARLSDLGKIHRGAPEATTITRLDGSPAVTFSVFKTDESSEISVSNAIDARLEEVAAKHSGLRFERVLSVVPLTERGYRSTVITFIEGAVLTVLVIFLFLRDRRATIIAALAIPLSIIPTFLCMQWLGFTLNFVSTVAISLVTGVLVDDAIVEIENIHRHMREGRTPMEAAIEASEEIGLSVIATTLVICAVFVPVSFMDGIIGRYFIQFGLTIAIAAFFSLLVARLFTPMLASRLLKATPVDHDKHDGPIMTRYLRIVDWTLRHRARTLAISLLIVAGSVALVPLLPAGFMPYQDLSQASISLEMPRGSTVEQTDAAAQRVARILSQRPEVDAVLTTSGELSGGANQAKILVALVPPDQRELDEREFAAELQPQLNALPDMRISFDNNTGGKDVSIVLVGEDVETLTRTAEALEREMREVPGLVSVTSSNRQRQREIVVEMDPIHAARLGVTAAQVGHAINVSTIGDDPSQLPKFSDKDREIPIRVRLPNDFGDRLTALNNLKLQTASGESVPLSSVAKLSFGQGPALIERYDRQRQLQIDANLDNIPLGTALERIAALPTMRNLPPSVSERRTGEAELIAEVMTGFLQAMAIGLLLVYSIQVLLYHDWLLPLARMGALPLSIGGAFMLMFVTRTELGLPALIGVMMLMGIADKNSILLVDHMLERMRAGTPKNEALITACRVRARPIVMTSVAMAAGMLPAALKIGLDADFRAPMAIALIGGLISSTALSLLFMPAIFSLVNDFEVKLSRRFHRAHH